MTGPPHSLFEQPWPEGDYRFFQLGHVVDDIAGAAAGWIAAFGIGPFHVLPVVDQELTYADGHVRTHRIQVAVAQAGPVQIELIKQHCDTPSIYQDWSRGGTSRLHQIATVTSEYDEKKAYFETVGHLVAAESLSSGFRIAYVDTVAAFGFYTELVEMTPHFLDQLATIASTCATWDGTDPLRFLIRGGYRTTEEAN